MSDFAARAALQRMHLRPVAIAAQMATLVSDMHQLANANHEQAELEFQQRRVELCSAYGLRAEVQNKPFAFAQGLAIIPVHGSLINRFSYSWGYVTGYNFLRQQVAMAAADPEVLGIIFDVNSYGGEAAGCFECSRDIRALANGKPTMAYVDSAAYSAAFATAVAADRIVVTPSAGVGSIGVVTMHVSMEKYIEKMGFEVTFIYSGDHKVDGNPFEALPDSVKAEVKARVDELRTEFAGLVAEMRKIDVKVVMDTEARTYRAEEAMSLGLIDAIAPPMEAARAFLGGLSGSPSATRMENSMTEATKPGATAANPEDPNKARTEGANAERARISGIQSCEEAKGREALANHIAFNTSMSLEEAKGMLAASPVAAAPTKTEGNPFAAAMDATENPNVGTGGAGGENGAMTDAQRIVASARASGLIGFADKQ